MTNHYDEMRVAPDPAQAEELRQRLHARMASVATDDQHGRSDLDLDSARLDRDQPVVPMNEIPQSDAPTPNGRTHGRRLVAAAAVIVVAIAAAGIAISNRNSGNKVDVSDTPTTTAPPATPAPLGAEEISVTPDFIHLGDGLVATGGIAKDNGRTYVVAAHYKDDGYHADEETLWWFRPETSVLVAFDDAGVELWRTELDGVPGAAAVAGDVWLLENGTSRVDGVGTLSRIDGSDGRVVDQMNVGEPASMVGAFGSVWVLTGTPVCVSVDCVDTNAQLIRVEPDLSTTTVELPDRVLSAEYVPSAVEDVTAGPDAIWVPLGEGGVAVIDPVTNQANVIPIGDVGDNVQQRFAFDGDVTYVASRNQVTSIVDGEVLATASLGEIEYLGSIDGVVGALTYPAGFQVLGANDPMVAERRQISPEGQGVPTKIDGELWFETGRNYSPRRVELLPVSEGDG